MVMDATALLFLLCSILVAAFPKPFEPLENMDKIVLAQMTLDAHPWLFNYNLAELMMAWQHPTAHNCEEWAPAVTMDWSSALQYIWCGDFFCVHIYTQDDVRIDYIGVEIY